MKRLMLAAVLVAWPTVALGQANTTGTIAPNTTITQGPSTTTGTAGAGTTTTPSTTATPGTTSSTIAAPARDAAILVCGQEFSTGAGRLLVAAASVSGGITAPSPGAQCAQALADLFLQGFAVIDVLPLNQQLQYTLVR